MPVHRKIIRTVKRVVRGDVKQLNPTRREFLTAPPIVTAARKIVRAAKPVVRKAVRNVTAPAPARRVAVVGTARQIAAKATSVARQVTRGTTRPAEAGVTARTRRILERGPAPAPAPKPKRPPGAVARRPGRTAR